MLDYGRRLTSRQVLDVSAAAEGKSVDLGKA